MYVMPTCHYWCFVNGTVSLSSNVLLLLISFELVVNYARATAAKSVGCRSAHSIFLSTCSASSMVKILPNPAVPLGDKPTPVCFPKPMMPKSKCSDRLPLFIVCCTTVRCMQEIAEELDTVPLHTGFFTMAREQDRSSPFPQGHLGCSILSLLMASERFHQFSPDSSFWFVPWWIHIFFWNIPHLANLSFAPCRVNAQWKSKRLSGNIPCSCHKSDYRRSASKYKTPS